MRKSSRGNPYHDSTGKFASKNGRRFERAESYYTKRSRDREKGKTRTYDRVQRTEDVFTEDGVTYKVLKRYETDNPNLKCRDRIEVEVIASDIPMIMVGEILNMPDKKTGRKNPNRISNKKLLREMEGES